MSITFTLGELAKLTHTQVKGDASRVLRAVAPVDQAGPDDISFIRDPHYARFLQNSRAGALILTEELAEQHNGDSLVSQNPYRIYSRITTLFNPVQKPPPGIAPSAVVADSTTLGKQVSIGANAVIAEHCQIGDNVVIGAGCYIGPGCQIGANSYLHPQVTLQTDTQLGHSVIIHPGAVLGADGFGFVPDEDKSWEKIPQVGRVRIGNQTEIGANTAIDRAALGETVLGHGVKLDNLIHIAHNVHIGDHTVIAACTGIAGSAKIGKYCQISGMCSIAGHLEITDYVTITATSFVTQSISKPGVYSSGTTTDEHKHWRKNAVRFRQLDQMSRKISQLEMQLQQLSGHTTQNKD